MGRIYTDIITTACLQYQVSISFQKLTLTFWSRCYVRMNMNEQVQWHEKGIEPHPNFFVSVCASLTKLSDLRNDLSCCIMQLNLSSSSDRWPDVLLQDFLSDAGINVSLNCGKPPDLEAAKLSHSITLPPPCMTESIMAVLLYSLFSLSALMIPCLPVT